MIPVDCKTCDHRHYIDGEYVRDCYSHCPYYQDRQRKKQEEKDARRKEHAIEDYLIKTNRKMRKMRE